MAYFLKSYFGTLSLGEDGSEKTYHIDDCVSEAAIDRARQIVADLNSVHNAKVEQRRDGLYVCWNNYEMDDYEKVVSYNPEYIAKQDLSDLPKLSGTFSSQSTNSVTNGPLNYKPDQTTGDAKLPYIGGAYPLTPDYISPEEFTKKWNEPYFQLIPRPQQGWICPICGAGNSPYEGKCDCTQKHDVIC
jgi:hypothetical protein